MQCEQCHGDRFVVYPYPCDMCGGTGITHCCEGERPIIGSDICIHGIERSICYDCDPLPDYEVEDEPGLGL